MDLTIPGSGVPFWGPPAVSLIICSDTYVGNALYPRKSPKSRAVSDCIICSAPRGPSWWNGERNLYNRRWIVKEASKESWKVVKWTRVGPVDRLEDSFGDASWATHLFRGDSRLSRCGRDRSPGAVPKIEGMTLPHITLWLEQLGCSTRTAWSLEMSALRTCQNGSAGDAKNCSDKLKNVRNYRI